MINHCECNSANNRPGSKILSKVFFYYKLYIDSQSPCFDIEADIMPRLSTKFAANSFVRTGQGLYISKSIVEGHGRKV
jgi:hypothetical protein